MYRTQRLRPPRYLTSAFPAVFLCVCVCVCVCVYADLMRARVCVRVSVGVNGRHQRQFRSNGPTPEQWERTGGAGRAQGVASAPEDLRGPMPTQWRARHAHFPVISTQKLPWRLPCTTWITSFDRGLFSTQRSGRFGSYHVDWVDVTVSSLFLSSHQIK